MSFEEQDPFSVVQFVQVQHEPVGLVEGGERSCSESDALDRLVARICEEDALRHLRSTRVLVGERTNAEDFQLLLNGLLAGHEEAPAVENGARRQLECAHFCSI